MNKLGNIVLCVLVFTSTLSVAYERQEQDGVAMTADIFTDNQDEIVTRGVKARDFAWHNIFPIQIVVENKSQSTIRLNPRDLPLELADTFNTVSCMCMRNAQYINQKVGYSLEILLSMVFLLGTPIVEVILSDFHADRGVRNIVAGVGLGLGGLLMALGLKEGYEAEKVKDKMIADLEASYDPITINPGQVIKRTFFFNLPQEDLVTFYITDQSNGKLLTFDFELE